MSLLEGIFFQVVFLKGNNKLLETFTCVTYHPKIKNVQGTCLFSGRCIYIYIYPQTGTLADPETHPLRGFGPLCCYRVLAFGRFFSKKCYGMDCFGTYFTHVQTCDVTRVQNATEWTASAHTLHMSKPVM